MAILIPVKKGPSVRNEEQDDMSSVMPPWVYELAGEATVLPIATFGLFKVGLIMLFLCADEEES